MIVGFAACGEESILNNLTRSQSIETSVVLARHGIDSERVLLSSGKEEKYSIVIQRENKDRALEIIQQYGLPKEQSEGVDDLLHEQGFIPNPLEINALRLDRALSLQIERSLLLLPGIIDAKVIVRSNFRFRNISGEKAEPATASVVIKYMASGDDIPFALNTVRQIISQAVPGLKDEDVRVATARLEFDQSFVGKNGELEMLSPFGFEVSRATKSKAILQILLLIFSCVLFGGACGIYLHWLITRQRESKKQLRRQTSFIKNDFLVDNAIRSRDAGMRR